MKSQKIIVCLMLMISGPAFGMICQFMNQSGRCMMQPMPLNYTSKYAYSTPKHYSVALQNRSAMLSTITRTVICNDLKNAIKQTENELMTVRLCRWKLLNKYMRYTHKYIQGRFDPQRKEDKNKDDQLDILRNKYDNQYKKNQKQLKLSYDLHKHKKELLEIILIDYEK